ncbi:alpha/beta fold hydrolase [Emcibacter nanhaiensis]|uniref:Alpha/beta hydrolase n=1 Tax=Emcibacter nanhaiensis TaxID=1505037 RepID=A0A501PFY5_9PROT|nr:alpha/beta hydrolase [Emcibacter nanhaiensis]TPD59389.1 alpha/beta hydrolase [Emcibacter nanhaiensis]
MTSNDFFPENSKIAWLERPDGIRLRIVSIEPDGPVRGQIVIVNGHREYMEKYQEFFQDFLDRGLRVYSMDHRGQGLSSRLLKDRHKSYIKNFDLYLSDLAEMMSHYDLLEQEPRKLPLYLLGHSMGGHIAFRFLHDHPGVFDRAVLMAPMLGINLGSPIKALFTPSYIQWACLFGWDKEYAPGQEPKNADDMELMVSDLLTHDLSRHEAENQIMKANPDLYAGGATYGWLKAALDSIDILKQRGYAEAITLPVLALLAEEERLVVNEDACEILGRLPNSRIEVIKGAFHEIYREADDIRQEMWRLLDGFLAVEDV